MTEKTTKYRVNISTSDNSPYGGNGVTTFVGFRRNSDIYASVVCEACLIETKYNYSFTI